MSVQTTMFVGTVMTGGTLSPVVLLRIVTVKVPMVTLPSASVGRLGTVVTPTGKLEPDGGVLTTVGTEQLSVAVTLKSTTALAWPTGMTTEMLAGRLSTGINQCSALVNYTVTVTD